MRPVDYKVFPRYIKPHDAMPLSLPIRIMVHDDEGATHGLVVPYFFVLEILRLDLSPSGEEIGVEVDAEAADGLIGVARDGIIWPITPRCIEVLGAAVPL